MLSKLGFQGTLNFADQLNKEIHENRIQGVLMKPQY